MRHFGYVRKLDNLIKYPQMLDEANTTQNKGEKTMNIILEGTRNDGTRMLIAPSKIREYAKDANEASAGSQKRAMKLMLRSIAMMCYSKNIQKLVEIKYDSDGNQKRTTLVVAA